MFAQTVLITSDAAAIAAAVAAIQGGTLAGLPAEDAAALAAADASLQASLTILKGLAGTPVGQPATADITPGGTAPVPLPIGATQKFSSRPLDVNGVVIAGPVPVWSSSDATVATVDAGTGLATGVAAGKAIITATYTPAPAGFVQPSVTVLVA